jgi:ribosomal protein S18 acetylase RimI-like enzyme
MPEIYRNDDGVRVVHCEELSEAEPHRARFVLAYRRIFAGSPYFEDFTPAEAGDVLDQLLATPGQITLLALHGDDVVGFGMAVPLAASARVSRLLQGMVPVKATVYLAELGVDPAWRRRGLGRLLVKLRVERIDPSVYTHVVLRVAEGRTESFEMYRALGFAEMGVAMEVHRRRVDGTVRGDTRHFMSKVLTAVRA